MDKKPNIKLVKQFNRELVRLRKKIPDRYNQVQLLDYVTDDEIDVMTSITTRSDGKSFNYFNTMFQLALKFDEFKILVLARHYDLRKAYRSLFEKILHIAKIEPARYYFVRNEDYTQLIIDDKPIAIISDLNNATDLKYHSNVLQDYRLLVYDEFLALEGDYLIDEKDRLKTIYESVDRGENELLPQPKIMLLGNPVNFASPLLSYWGMFDILETQPMNSVKKSGNIVIERYVNENQNETKNNRLFHEENNSSITGQFNINNDLVIPIKEKEEYKHEIVVKLKVPNTYLKVRFKTPKDYYISFDSVPRSEYDYCMNLADWTKETTYVYDPYMSDEFHHYYDKQKILFGDTFSITFIDRYPEYKDLNIHKLIRDSNQAEMTPYEVNRSNEETYEQVRRNDLIKKLFRQYEQ